MTKYAMAEEERDRQPSFKVQDRRRFSATGEAREDEDAPADAVENRAEERARDQPPPRGADAAPSAASDTAPADHDAEYPEHDALHDVGAGEITFASFVFSLSTQVLIHLGEIPDPVDGAAHVNLDAARQIIDILAILKEKTAGNLDAAESALLENALYDLRMRYVDRARHP